MTTSKSPKYRKRSQSKSKSSKSLVLTLGATALLIVGGGLAYFLSQNKGGSSILPVGSQLLPADTSSSITLTTQESLWRRLQDFNIPQTRQVIQSGFNQFKSDVIGVHGLDYNQDIQPWIGDRLTEAVLTPAASPEETLAPTSKVWVLPVRNAGRAKSFLSQDLARGGGSVSQSTYQGVDIQSLTSQGVTLYLAMITPEQVVMANDLPAMREVIDTAKGQNSLAVQERFQLAMKEIKTDKPLAQIYWNVPANTSQIFEQEGRQLDQSALERLQQYQGIGSAVEFSNEGLKFHSISWLNPESSETLTVTGAPEGIAKWLPNDTFLMMSGDNFQQVWQDYQNGVETQLLLPFSPKALQSNFTKLTGLNFEQQFLPWMTGDFAAGVVPTTADSTKDAGVVFLVKVQDKTAAEQALRDLETQMQEKYSLQMSETKMNDRSVVQWRVPPNLPIASRGWLGDKVLFFTLFSPLTERVVTDQQPLTGSDSFKTATQSQLTPKSGQFFFDVPKLTQFMATSQFLPKLTPEYQKYAKEFESVGGTSTTLNDWSTRYEISVNFLKK